MKRIPMMPFLGLLACICLVLSACQKELSIETNANLAAQGTLKDTTTGECMPEIVTGTFYGGIEPGRDTAYVSVNVMVTNPGTYTIYTDTEDGFYFSDSGYFANTGLNVIKLKPVGTPIIPGTYDFNVTFDTSICSFSINVQDSTGTGLGGGTTNPNEDDHAWQFTGPDGSYNGHIAEATERDTIIESIPAHYVSIFGLNSTGDSAMQIIVGFPGSTTIVTGSYNSTSNAAFNFQDGIVGEFIYQADFTKPTVNTVVKIISYNAVTHIISGTFEGQAVTKDGNPVGISNGSFTAKIQ